MGSLSEVLGGGLVCRLAAGRVVLEHHLHGLVLPSAHCGGIEQASISSLVVDLRRASIVASMRPARFRRDAFCSVHWSVQAWAHCAALEAMRLPRSIKPR